MDVNDILAMTPSDLEHHGVKGQKWGVRRKIKSGVTTAKNEVKLRNDSAKRERSWAKTDVSKMSTSQLRNQASRVRLENELKRHARGTGNKTVKREYLNRSKIDDATLRKRVERLNLEREFNKSAKLSSKSQRDLAKSIIKSAAKDPTPTGVATGVVTDQVNSYVKDKRKYNK